MKTLSQKLQCELTEYYESEGLIPDARFACKYYKNGECPDLVGEEPLARGMQCHIGRKYGEKMKVLVASLDCGSGGADNIKGRTEAVESVADNPHMRGTYKALSYFLDMDDPRALIDHMVMTNTCKCCRRKSANQLGIQYYLNCGEYGVEEIYRFKPDVVLFQGKNAPAYSLAKHYLRPINDCEQSQMKELMYFEYKDYKCYAVLCIHPSARGRHAKKRNDFYYSESPLIETIAKYIKEHPLKK